MADDGSEDRAEQFADRLADVLNGGMLALMTSIGHRTGLFDVLAGLPPARSSEIADAAGLNERYVREWLAAMTTGRFIEHDPAAMTFALPPRACRLANAGRRARQPSPADAVRRADGGRGGPDR
jgi:hypothetical protein